MTERVLVLGCGPAGLMAAHAATLAGYEATVVSRRRKSEMYGAQYLHHPIPHASPDGSFRVQYRLEGDVRGYRDKVYGPTFKGIVSPEDLEHDHQGWDIRATYDTLWQHYGRQVEDTSFKDSVEATAFIQTIQASGAFALIISTIPAPMLCTKNNHNFGAQQVYAIGDAPERGVFSPIITDLNTVTCNGLMETSWYRCANILGYNTVEWPGKTKPPLTGVASVLKPLAHTCDCLPDVLRVGRYGKWQKGVLSHTAFVETSEYLQ